MTHEHEENLIEVYYSKVYTHEWMEIRKHRGAAIAERGGLRQRGPDLWMVPSQTGTGTWVVDYQGPEPTCTCPDYEKRSAFCKHIFAVEIHLRRLEVPTEAETVAVAEPKKYTQDWPAYNRAQMAEKDHFVQLLHGLCAGLQMPVQRGRGNPYAAISDVVFGCVFKVYGGKSGRVMSADLKDCERQGLVWKAPSYNTISRYLNKPELGPILKMLLHESALPLQGIERKFAADSTGFSTKIYQRWFDEKWGKPRKQAKFVKAHAMCGTLTHVVTDVIISDAGDATQFKPLLDATVARFIVDEVSADKAYSSRANLQAVADAGAVPYIPFREGTTGKGPDLWRKMWAYYQYKRDDFLGHYHQRSNAETVFSMVKRKFGGSVRSKDEVAQANEILCKFICLNICVLISSIYELGIVPEFWQAEGRAS